MPRQVVPVSVVGLCFHGWCRQECHRHQAHSGTCSKLHSHHPVCPCSSVHIACHAQCLAQQGVRPTLPSSLVTTSVPDTQVLSLKSIQFTITDRDFDAIAGLEELQEIVLDCDQPPEGQGQTDEAKWGLLHFPEAMKQLTNMTHLTLSCHYGITALPQGISRLDKLEVSPCQPS